MSWLHAMSLNLARPLYKKLYPLIKQLRKQNKNHVYTKNLKSFIFFKSFLFKKKYSFYLNYHIAIY